MGMELEVYDDNLERFSAEGVPSLVAPDSQTFLEHNGARIWYATYGNGSPVILLHGGLGHSGNWNYQVPSLIESGYKVISVDSRGHGRSTRDDQPFSYELMASDVLAIMDSLHLEKAALVGWSDGACTALVLAATAPSRVSGVFYFACNMDPSGVKPFEVSPALDRCFNRHAKDYSQLSSTPDRFEDLVKDLTQMQRAQPNYSTDQLASIGVPVMIVQSEHDEFIRQEHAEYLARSIPQAEFLLLKDVSHFAPLQRPTLFSSAVLSFLARYGVETVR